MAGDVLMTKRGGYHQEDAKYTDAGKEKKREAQEKMARQHTGGNERIRYDRRHGRKLSVAYEDKGRLNTTQNMPIGEKNI